MDQQPLFRPPSAPQPPGKKELPVWLIILFSVLAASVVVALVITIAVPAVKRAKEKAATARIEQARNIGAAPKIAPPSLTEAQREELPAFGQMLADAISVGDEATLKRSMDYEALADRTLGGLDLPKGTREGFVQGASGKKGGFLAEIFQQRTRFLRVRERGGWPAITLRTMPPSGGAQYIDLLVIPSGKGFKVVDMFNHLFGAYGSQNARQLVSISLAKDGEGFLKILNLQGTNSREGDQLLKLVQHYTKGDMVGIIRAYEALPENLKTLKMPFICYFSALQAHDDPASEEGYPKAMEAAPAILGPETSIELLRVDSWFLKKDYRAALSSVEKTMEAIGEDDAYLHQLRGVVALRVPDLELAEASLKRGEELEPDFVGLVDLRLMLLASKKDYAGVVAELRRFASVKGQSIQPEALKDEIYEGFRQSPEFTEWAASLK